MLSNIPENIANSFVKGFGREMLKHHKHSWNILKQAQGYLKWQWRFDYSLWERKNEIHFFVVSKLHKLNCQGEENSEGWTEIAPSECGIKGENMCILANQHAKAMCVVWKLQALLWRVNISFELLGSGLVVFHFFFQLVFCMKAHPRGLRGQAATVQLSGWKEVVSKHFQLCMFSK